MAYKDKAQAMKKQNEWINKAYDRINLTVPKGSKADISATAKSIGMSLNGFINRAIANETKRVKGEE